MRRAGVGWITRWTVAVGWTLLGSVLCAHAGGVDWAEKKTVDALFLRGLRAEVHGADDALSPAESDAALRDLKRCSLDLRKPSRRGTTKDLYRRSCPSIVVVGTTSRCSNCDKLHILYASGFVVHRDGIIATNYHVVEADEDDEHIGIMTHDGRVLKVLDVVASSKVDDVALLRVDADDLSPLPIAESASVGEDVFVISHPVNRFYTMTDGIVSGYQVHRHDDETRQMMSITADFAKGSSGAPVLNAKGAVVGMVCSTKGVYYDSSNGKERFIQMVWKQCIPSAVLLDLTRPAND